MCHRYREAHTNTRTNTHTSTHISAHPHSHSLMLPWACLPSAQWHLKGAASSPASCQVSFFKAAEADQMLKIPQVLSVHIDFAFSCYVSAPPQHHPTGHPTPLTYFATFCTSFSALPIQMPRNSSQYVFCCCSLAACSFLFGDPTQAQNELID